MKRMRNWTIGLLLAAGLLGVSYWWLGPVTSAQSVEESAADEIQTAVARQGDLVISATGAGTVISTQTLSVGVETAGVLVELNGRVGDTVTAGDVLARVDDADAQQALVNAEIAYSKILMQTDGSVTQAGVSYDDISVLQAEINLAQAEQALDELLNWAPDADEIEVAEANVAAAEASLNSAQGQASSSSYGIEISAISLEQAQRDLADAEEAYATAYDPARDWETQYNEPICSVGEQEPCTGQTYVDRITNERAAADNALLRAQENLSIAQIQYNQTVANSSSSSVANAETSVLNAQLALDAVMNGPTEDEIEAAEVSVQQAELALQQALLNAEASLLDLEQAMLNVTSAETAVGGTVLSAPIDGVLMEINAAVGETVSTSPFITLADLEQPVIEIYLDESDLNMVGLGFEVEVVFDAFPDDTYTGTIIQVDPQLTTQNGLNVIRAEVQLDESSFAKPQTLPIGLNATVEVIGGRAENAVLVPVEALRELTPGSYSLFVMENGELELRAVEVGLMDFTFAEIISGLEAGETVTTGIVETQ